MNNMAPAAYGQRLNFYLYNGTMLSGMDSRVYIGYRDVCDGIGIGYMIVIDPGTWKLLQACWGRLTAYHDQYPQACIL
jgi:hypothetical protein